MRWRALAAVLVAVLAGALVYAVLGAGVEPPVAPALSAAPAPVVTAPPAHREEHAPAPVRPPPPPQAPAPSLTGPPSVPAPGSALPPTAATDEPSRGVAAGAGTSAAADAGIPFRIDKDGIKSAIGEKIPELRQCYEDWLQANPTLAGRMKVSFTIAEDPQTGLGDVTQLEIADGDLDHFALQGCVMNVFKDLHFEAPANGPVRVNYPLNFSAGDGG